MLSRRQFFSKLLGSVAGLLTMGLVLNAQADERRKPKTPDAPAGGGKDIDLPLVKPGVAMAASLSYVEAKKDLKNEALKTERTGVKWDQQVCEGCLLFTVVGEKGGQKLGKCQLFQGQLVKAKGWCNSWAKRPT